MKVITNDIWLCSDCTMVAVNGDYSGLDYYLGPKAAERRAREIDAGLAALGPHLVPDDERGEGYEEFSHRECDCCGDDLAGSRHRFAILGEGEDEDEDEDEDESAQMTLF